MANTFVQTLTLVLALIALGNRVDTFPPFVVILMSASGLGLVMLSTVMLVNARARHQRVILRYGQPGPDG
jgi:hypothetical protein